MNDISDNGTEKKKGMSKWKKFGIGFFVVLLIAVGLLPDGTVTTDSELYQELTSGLGMPEFDAYDSEMRKINGQLRTEESCVNMSQATMGEVYKTNSLYLELELKNEDIIKSTLYSQFAVLPEDKVAAFIYAFTGPEEETEKVTDIVNRKGKCSRGNLFEESIEASAYKITIMCSDQQMFIVYGIMACKLK